MRNSLKIAIIGDFNFAYNAHHATNLAIEHVGEVIDIGIDYYWIRTYEATSFKINDFQRFDGIWVSSGPYENDKFVTHVVNQILESNIPLLITGEAFKNFLEVIVDRFRLNKDNRKVLSTNLISQNKFQSIKVIPVSKNLRELYGNEEREELTSAQFAIYPEILFKLEDEVIDVEGINQFDEPEIISLKSRDFCVATVSLPQICSTREAPHPLILGYINYIKNTINKAG